MRRSKIRTGLALRDRSDRYITNWIDRLSGVPAFIIGNGCSVSNHDFSLLKDYFTIGINRAFKLIDPTILFWQDISLVKDEGHILNDLQALKVCRDIADPKRLYHNYHLKAGEYKFYKQTRTLFGSGSSGPIACELAFGLGCSHLVLLGMDCKRGPEGQSDFYGNNPHWFDKTLVHCQKGLKYILEHCPIPIVCCSDNDVWPQISLEEAIKSVDPNTQFALGRDAYVSRIIGS